MLAGMLEHWTQLSMLTYTFCKTPKGECCRENPAFPSDACGKMKDEKNAKEDGEEQVCTKAWVIAIDCVLDCTFTTNRSAVLYSRHNEDKGNSAE